MISTYVADVYIECSIPKYSPLSNNISSKCINDDCYRFYKQLKTRIIQCEMFTQVYSL